jgi:hypothetical protein
MCMKSVGSVIHTDVTVGRVIEARRSMCVVCTAACLVEVDLISGPRQATRYTTYTHTA